MTLSQSSSGKNSPDHSSSKLKQKRALEFKKKLLSKRPMGLKHNTQKAETEDKKKSSISYGCAEINPYAMNRAQEVQANLPSRFPSFVKLMLRSHVTGGFWLGLPKSFCSVHLPKHDDNVFLVGENEEEYLTKFLAVKTGLSGGWRGFSIAHKLLEGDVLVFQLIESCKFKVYIVRANDLTEIDGAIGLLNLDFEAKPIVAKPIRVFEERMEICEAAGKGYLESLKSDGCQGDNRRNDMMALDAQELPSNESGNESDDFGSEVLEGIRFSESPIDFKQVKNFEGFNILVDGLVVDSEIPSHIRKKYYELCCSQKSYLHHHLVEGLNCKLAAGVISETVNIADAIRAAKLNTSCKLLETWDKTLKAFQDLGMAVGFLRDRLNELIKISNEQQKKIESKTLERTKVEEEIRILNSKLINAKQVIYSLDAELEALKMESKMFEPSFREAASAPW